MTSGAKKSIVEDVLATYKNLDLLRSRNSYLATSTDLATLHKNLAALDSGMDEANLILELSRCFSELEAENQLLKLRVQKLEENNFWLSEELRNTQNKLQASEQKVEHLEVEKKHLKFVAGLQDSKLEDEGIGENLNSTLNSDKQEEWNINRSASDSGLDEDCASILARPTFHSLPDIENRAQKVNPKLSTSIDVDKLARSLLIGEMVSPAIRKLCCQVINYATKGRIDQAARFCELNLGKLEDSVGQRDAIYVSTLVVLATIYQFQGKHELSISLLKWALELREGLLSSTHLSTVDLHNRLGLIFIEVRKFQDAEFHLRKALKIKMLHFGEHHEDVAKQLKNLAIMYRRQQKFEEAAHYYNSTARIYRDKYGSNDLLTIKAINDSVVCNLKHQEFVKKIRC